MTCIVMPLADFKKNCKKIFSSNELNAFTDYIAENPTRGVIIPGTGGVRKVRWKAKNKGKSGGARVIYYYCNKRVKFISLTYILKIILVI